jgi:hypothetical protein
VSVYCGGGVGVSSLLGTALGLKEGEFDPDLSALLAMPGEEGGRRKAGHSEVSGVVGF